mgnify:CR=1 FL=1
MSDPVKFAVALQAKNLGMTDEELEKSGLVILLSGYEDPEVCVHKIKKAKSIFIKGTMGVCEEKEFCYGTKELLNAVVKSKAFSVVGGGHITTAMKKLKIPIKKFGYISLSGGALIAYICGENLPGLEVLNKRK